MERERREILIAMLNKDYDHLDEMKKKCAVASSNVIDDYLKTQIEIGYLKKELKGELI